MSVPITASMNKISELERAQGRAGEGEREREGERRTEREAERGREGESPHSDIGAEHKLREPLLVDGGSVHGETW